MKKKILNFLLVICLVLPCAVIMAACGGKKGEYYVTTLPEEYEIVLRTQYLGRSGQYEYVQQTFIVCKEDNKAEKTYYYKREYFGTDSTYNPASLSANDITENTDHSSIEWHDLSYNVYADVGFKYFDANIENNNEIFNGTPCVTYNYKNACIEKISKDDYHMRWYFATYNSDDDFWVITEVASFKTTNVTVPTNQ